MRRKTTTINQGETGTALVWALMFVVVTAGMIMSHTTFMHASRKSAQTESKNRTLSTTFARSGLVETLSWFQRQPQQPVTAFDPQFNPTGNPPSFDTEDSGVGLVRHFQVRGNLWGRYEIRRGEAADVSSARGQSQAGSVWSIRSRGVLYHRNDPSLPPGKGSNTILGAEVATTEIRGVPTLMPAPAAVAVDDRAALVVASNGIIDGGTGIAIASPPPGVLLAVPPGVSGVPPSVEIPTYDATELRVFGMGWEELSEYSSLEVDGAFADDLGGGFSDTTALLPKKLPKDTIILIKGNTLVPAGRKLKGRAFWVFQGDVHFAADNHSDLKGIVYVAGDATFEGKFQLKGSLVVRGGLTVGGGNDTAKVEFKQNEVDRVRKGLQRYRKKKNHGKKK